MKTITFGQTGVEVSAICLGAMEFGTSISKDKSYEVLDMYFENGGRYGPDQLGLDWVHGV